MDSKLVDAQDDKSLPPYDPIENYISPRPKYLSVRVVPSSDDCSVEETEDLVKESLVSTHAENEGEKEEFDEVEDGSGRTEAKLRLNTSLFCRRRN
ncbi:hypothetical protein Tco_0384968 [Tanacetum coccineum]